MARSTTEVRVGVWAPADARHFVRDELVLADGWIGQDLVDDAELLVSEVVTVATLRSGSDEATVAVAADDCVIRVEVTDAHRGFTSAGSGLDIDRDGPDALGLNIVDWVAPRWGVDLSKPGKTVWFELDDAIV